MNAFDDMVASLGQRGLEWHGETILANSIANAPHIVNTIRAIKPQPRPCLIVSAGPSLYRERILARIYGKFQGTIIATDSAYIQCLKAGIVPDYVITLDPHPTRMVRWFGDYDLEANLNGDDYFARQDLDIAFRNNQKEENDKNIALVDLHRVPLVIASTAPQNVAKRTELHERYWFAPLVDDPDAPDSLTRRLVDATGSPALNTGGTVGTAAWVFGQAILKSSNIAVVGMDFSYYYDTPIEQTQSWHMLGGDHNMYPMYNNPDGRRCYTDPTYFWYLDNFLALLEANEATVTNCSGAGLLYGANVKWQRLEEWLASLS